MVQKAENLRKESVSYFKGAKKVNEKVRCNRIVIIIAIILVVLVKKFVKYSLFYTYV